ncbi:MAG: hypothetical protein PHT92_08405, partial [Bacteroidales bacterium]|nr:hypothetical protein [Bacteroidales bacterium]
MSILLSVISLGGLFAQTDTIFWFSAPEVNRYHSGGNGTDPENFGTPVYLRLTTGDKPANVTISMPANPSFTPIEVPPIAEYTTYTLDLSGFIKNHEEIDGNGGLPGLINDPTSIENVLAWTESNLAPAGGKPYINRNNKGILIESTAPITAYYEISVQYNRDLIALKGQNALGTEFYVPFQTTNETRSYPFKYRPYSSIDIVATEDNTKVWFTATQDIWVKGVGFREKGTYSMWLNKGETSIITPFENIGGAATGNYQTTFAASKRLAGTRVWVDVNEGSGGNIAIISHDDLVKSQNSLNPDYVTDQIVPITHIGTEYAVIRGVNYSDTESEDFIYVVGTVDGTDVTVVTDPTAHTETFTVNSGESKDFHMSSTEYNVASVYATEPVYVYHMSGTGRQKAGALIPTITKCSGSNRVAFNRTTGGTFAFYLNILVWVSPISDARGDFKLIRQGGALDGDDNSVLALINDPNNFRILPTAGAGVEFGNWYYARINASGLDADIAYTLENTENVFHLGVINGHTSDDAFYGYFSNFNEIVPQGIVVETGSNGGKFCPGVTLEMEVSGGTKYLWSPDTYLDNPNIRNPVATNIETSIDYKVTVSGYCDLTKYVDIAVKVGDGVIPNFTSGTYSGCAAPVNPGDIPSYTFTLTNDSDGDYYRDWWYRRSDETTFTDIVSGSNVDNSAEVVTLTLENNTDDIIEYYVTLRVKDQSSWCQDEVTKTLRVYPYIDINPSFNLSNDSDPNCQPHTVNFFANPVSEPIAHPIGATYKWDFGDGNSAPTQNAQNTYLNTAPPYSSISYSPEVTITDKWNVCSVTKSVDIVVPPYLEAGFTANPVTGCSPLQVTNFSNTSKGVPTEGYSWKLFRLGAPDVEVGSSTTGSPPDISSASTWLVNNRTDNLEEVYRLDLEVTNASGCVKTYSQEFRVYPNPTATVSIDAPGAPDINCSPLQIDLSATTIRNTNSFQWHVDGVSRLSNPVPIGSPPADYTGSLTLENITNAPIAKVVSYKATNNWGCDYVAPPLNVNVQPHIHSEIVLDPEVICPDSETGLFDVQILDAKIVADGQYEWFIDGVSQGINTDIGTRTFNYNTLTKNANGEAFINLQLVVENAAGCTKIDNQQITVNPQVSVDFDAHIGASLITPGAGGTGTTLCPPETLDFTSSTTYANSYQWKFGSIKEATSQNASLDIENNGSSAFDLPVTLTASNSYGCSGTVTKIYTIEPEVITNFDVESLAGCAPFTLDVSAVDNGTTYNWEFVGQNRTGADQVFNPVENKTGASLYETITLEAVRGNCTLVKNDVVVTIYPEVQAQWDFTAPTDYCAPVVAATFDNTSDLYAGGSVTNIHWQVFDGATMVNSSSAQSFTPSLPNTSHTAQKTYDIKLTATSAYGCVGEHDGIITVNPNPLARFNASVTEECTPLVLDVVNESVTTATSTYTWSWDGGSANDENANPIEITYNNNTEIVDSKHINLHIENEYGCVSDYDYLFEVFPQVIANLSITRLAPNENCGDEEFTFTNTSTAGSSIHYYEWSFGTDKWVTSSTADFNRSFTAHGTNPLDIPVSVRAYSTIGCTNVTPAEETIYIFPRVVAAQSFTIGDICDGDVDLTLTNASSNVGTSPLYATTDFLWTFTPSTADGTLTTSSGATAILTNGGDINPVVYDVDFVAETEWNYNGINRTCRDAITGNSVTVYPNLDLTFDIPEAECSTPTGVELVFAKNIPSSSGGDVNDISIAWDFGDGNTTSSNFDDVTHIFTNISNQPYTTATKFTATQLATGCTFEDNIPVTVYPTVTAAQSFTLGNLCGGEVEVTLANASSNTGVTTGTNNFEWRFTPDDLTNGATANFTSEGSYSLVNNGSIDPVTYSLEFFAETVWNEGAADEKSCSDIINPATQVVVYPELLPVFQAPDPACSGQTGVPLTFVKDNGASKGGNPTDVTIEWNFGDGNTESSNFNDVTHTFLNIENTPFTTATEYTATQLATGCTVTDAIPVTVYPRVTAAQSFTLGDLCGGEVEVTLTNASSNTGVTHTDATNYFSWVFTPDDAVNGTEETFTSTGTYPLANTGAITPVTYGLNFLARTVWHEGDALNELECAAPSTGNSVKVYPELIPEYEIPPAVCSDLTGATLEFNKNASSSGGGVGDVSLQWDFGDGNTRTTGFVNQVTKDFTNLSDEDFTTSTKIFATQLATGCTASREVDVIVHPKVESIFTFEIGDVCDYPLPVTFTNAAKYSKQAGVTTQFHWDYGYGGEEDMFNASSPLTHTHAFTNANPNQIVEYDVVFSITQAHPSGRTCANTSTRKIQVYPEMLPSFNLPTTEGCNPLTVSFSNTSTGVNLVKVDGTPWNGQFLWDLANGNTSNSITPAPREYGHTDKTKSLLYDISLTATNPLGCVKTATKSTPQVTVYPWVESSFAVDRIEGCTPLNVTLNNTSVSSTYTYQWNFTGNGSTVSTAASTAAQPGVITFTNPLGAGDVLSIQNPVIDLVTSLNTSVYTVGGGCAKSSTQVVSVFPHVYPNFDADLEGCHPLNINFDNTSNVFGGTGNGKYTWDLGIGVTTNNQSPTQEYQNSSLVANQSYNGRLTAVSDHGCTDFIPFTVTVWP